MGGRCSQWWYVAPVFYGIVLAYILQCVRAFLLRMWPSNPLRNVKSKLWKRVRRPLAVALAYLLVALVLVSIIAFIIPGLIESMGILADTVQQTVPGYVTSAMDWLNEFAQENDLTFIQDFLRNFNWSNVLSSASAVLRDFLSLPGGGHHQRGLRGVCRGDGFHFLRIHADGQGKLLRGVKSTLLAFLPGPQPRKIGQIATLTNRMFFNFIRGQLLECVILGSLCYVGMSILQLDYALLISSVVTLGALIPILGAYIGAAVGVLILLLVHPIDALIFLIFLLILQQVEGNMIYPRVVGSSIGLPPCGPCSRWCSGAACWESPAFFSAHLPRR